MKLNFIVRSAIILALAGPVFQPFQGVSRLLAQDSTKSAAQPEQKNAWSIGIYTGPSPFELSSPAGIQNPVLTADMVSDLKVNIVAHPFMAVTDSMYYLFFTAKNDLEGEVSGIGMAESRDGLHWRYRQMVIKEPFVLAYPYVFKWQDDYYLLPEAHKEPFLRLYKATHFPDKWSMVKDLLSGDHFISATPVRYHDMWWMYICRLGNETLRLFFASDLLGPWSEHPSSPVVPKDLDTARPAGRPLVIDGKLYRLGQDCDPTYGNQVHAFQITEISPSAYKEKMIEAPLAKASGRGWNAEAMHHIDVHQIGENKWIAAVDALGEIPVKSH